jgi:TolA-binding protein
MTRIPPRAIALLCLPLAGCFAFTTKHEGEELRKDVTKLEQGMGGKVEKLEKVLDEATKLLTRSSADVGAEVASLGEDQRRLTGLVMEAKRLADQLGPMVERHEIKLTELEARLAAVETKTAAPPAKSASDLWNEGQAAMSAGDLARAELAYRTLVVKYPGDGRAAEAQLQRAEVLVKQKRTQEALGEFQKVYDKYPGSPFADRALWRAGEMAEALKWCTDARAYYGLLRQKYPKSDLAKKAKDKDAALKKAASDKRKCQS